MPLRTGCGRKSKSEWSEVLGAEGTTKVNCKHCNIEISGKIERIKAHLRKCNKRLLSSATLQDLSSSTEVTEDSGHPSVSPQTPQAYCSKIVSINSDDVSDISVNSATSEPHDIQLDEATQPHSSVPTTSTFQRPLSREKEKQQFLEKWVQSQQKKHKIQPKLIDFAIVTTGAQQKSLDKAIARYFYASNLSFLTAEDKYFKELMNIARPGYHTPSRKDLAGRLLDEVYDDVETCLKEHLHEPNSTLTLCMDGWSSVRNDPILASSVHTGHSTFLLTKNIFNVWTHLVKIEK